MRKFNLEEYLNDPSKKLVLGNGTPARIICTDRIDDTYTIVALVRRYDDEGNLYEEYETFTPEGRIATSYETDELDIFFADEPIPEFKPYDRVLTRGSKGLPWKANLFSNFKMQGDTTIAVCLKGDYLLSDIIPFDESKVGKID